ncbi:hypothetical protein BZA05DRAFT_15267 [Tricharina praecox]|uniref:uncharacterized protein n=1 Tax=Tricharina praecox TaxID=43433 RepID=UPI00221E92F6|nr:uncharacterized protein BZA05DRAFT_15267 [Tricharina praecox]KAI5858825.1 hypothetical protein BZA05DRAFT_15267 [Tricharina praecox]
MLSDPSQVWLAPAHTLPNIGVVVVVVVVAGWLYCGAVSVGVVPRVGGLLLPYTDPPCLGPSWLARTCIPFFRHIPHTPSLTRLPSTIKQSILSDCLCRLRPLLRLLLPIHPHPCARARSSLSSSSLIYTNKPPPRLQLSPSHYRQPEYQSRYRSASQPP